MGRNGVNAILNLGSLSSLIDNYPPDNTERDFSFATVKNINEMLERLPTISVADVKVSDTIIVSSTQGVDPSRLTAIALVTGADTLLAMLAPRPQPGQTAPNPAAGLGSGISFGIGLP